MGEVYLDLLKAFGFKEMHIWIATISAILFSCNLLGGILSALMFVNSNVVIKRPLKDRISFRLFLLCEVMLLIFIFFYHVFMIERMSVSHVIYWVSAMMMMPLLAIIGSQAIMVTFSGRVKAKEEAYKRQQHALRAKRAKEMEKTNPAAGAAAGPKVSNLAQRALDARKHKR